MLQVLHELWDFIIGEHGALDFVLNLSCLHTSCLKPVSNILGVSTG